LSASIIALSGPAGCGKSTAAIYLVVQHGFVRVKFAAPLKAMIAALGFGDAEIEGGLKERPHPLLAGKTPRHAMQTLGTEWGRNCIGPDFWVGLWERTVCDVLDHGGRVVVDDCRFDNEAACVRRLGGRVVRLTGRGGIIPGAHASEAMSWQPDVLAANDNGFDVLYRQMDALVAA